MSKFKVGKRYRVVDTSFLVDGVVLTSSDNTFVVSAVDEDGDAWSCDSRYNGKLLDDGEGWCIATARELGLGRVVEVTDE